MELNDRLVYLDDDSNAFEIMARGTPSQREYGEDRARWFLSVETIGTKRYPRQTKLHTEIVAYRATKDPSAPVFRHVLSNLFPIIRPMGQSQSHSVKWSSDGEDSHFLFVASDETDSQTAQIYRADMSAQELERSYQNNGFAKLESDKLANLLQFKGRNWSIQRFAPVKNSLDEWIVLGTSDQFSGEALVRVGFGKFEIISQIDGLGNVTDFWLGDSAEEFFARSGTQIWKINQSLGTTRLYEDFSEFDWLTFQQKEENQKHMLQLRRICTRERRCSWQIQRTGEKPALLWTSLPDSSPTVLAVQHTMSIYHRYQSSIPIVTPVHQSKAHH